MRATDLFRVATIVLATFTVACGGSRSGSGVSKRPGGDDDGVLLIVDNTGPFDLVVYAFRAHPNSRARLGLVASSGTGRFRIPPDIGEAGRFGIVLDPVGSASTFGVPDITARTGQVVRVRVAASIGQSSWTVR